MISISVHGACKHFFSDSFISCKNALNEPNFINIGDKNAKLNNYLFIITETLRLILLILLIEPTKTLL